MKLNYSNFMLDFIYNLLDDLIDVSRVFAIKLLYHNNEYKLDNNLLNEIKLKYNHTFVKLSTIIASINKELAFETKIDEAEIGYLTLYFEKFYLEITTNKKVLLVCSTGIGTSELLKIRIKKKVPNLKSRLANF